MIDALSDRNYTLSQMTEFPSFAWYALEWDKLAADMYAAGRLCTAENCRERAKYYRKIVESRQVVIRLFEDGEIKLVELDNIMPVAAANSNKPLADREDCIVDEHR